MFTEFSFLQLKANNEAKVKIKLTEAIKNKDALLGRTLR